MMVGMRISADEAVVALRSMKRDGEASVVLCRKDGHFSRIEGSLLRSFRNADDGTVVVRGVSRPARTRLGRENRL